jgi:LCP family protein required for cell wall assembly
MPDERPTGDNEAQRPAARSHRARPRDTYTANLPQRQERARRKKAYQRSIQPEDSGVPARSGAPRRTQARDRYEAYRAKPLRKTSLPPTISGAAAVPAAIPALPALPRLVMGPPRRRHWPPSRPWRWAMVMVPLTVLIVAAIVLGPIIYQSQRAYREVFVAPVTHDVPRQVAVLNEKGTPVLAKAPVSKPLEWTGTERLTILLIGVDHPEGGASRTDTIILVNIEPVTKRASMLAIPRDLKVVIPGYGINKINAAFALGDYNKVPGGGAGLLIRTIEANLGIPITSFAQIDFDGFTRMIDTVGGVTIDIPYPIKDDAYPAANYQYQRIYFHAGWQHLNGARALEYARTRHQDTDAGRSRRQEQILLALRQKAITLNLLTKAPQLIKEFGDSVRTDISPDDALRLARLATEIPQQNIDQFSLFPALQEQQQPGQPYYLVADWPQVGKILGDFTGGTVNPPGAVLANPNYDLPILVENATSDQGLAGRVATVLEDNGFTNVSVAMAPSPQKETRIVDRGGNLGTSAVVTSLVGVGGDQIVVSTLEHPEGSPVAATPEATPAGMAGTPVSDYAIVVTLGDDAPDPAAVPLNNSDYQQQVGGDEAPADTSGDTEIQATEPAEVAPGS